MKYLVEELYTRCFYGEDFEKSEDKFLIGILNNDKSKLKDVVTGQVVSAFATDRLVALKSSARGGNDMALGYMTGCEADYASARQGVLALIIDADLKDRVVDTNQITRIKHIMNNEVIKYQKRQMKKKQMRSKEDAEYAVSEDERDF